MAEREGFEPSVQQTVQWFSRPPPSTSRTSLRFRLEEPYLWNVGSLHFSYSLKKSLINLLHSSSKTP